MEPPPLPMMMTMMMVQVVGGSVAAFAEMGLLYVVVVVVVLDSVRLFVPHSRPPIASPRQQGSIFHSPCGSGKPSPAVSLSGLKLTTHLSS